MSAPLFKADVLFYQRFLSCAGFYKDGLDGQWGKKTTDADAEFEKSTNETRRLFGAFDARSEGVISTLLPQAQIAARHFLTAAGRCPFTVKLLSGTRTYAEQNALFGKRPKVTNARGGQSNHNFGIAWDAGIFVNGIYYTGRNSKEMSAYADLASVAKANVHGIEWGGDWVSFKDYPHYQLSTGKSVSQLRALFEAGKPYV